MQFLSSIKQPRSMIQVTRSRRISPERAFFPALSCRLSRTVGRKSAGRWKQYSSWNFIVRENGKILQVPFTGFYPEVRGIRAGNQPEINVSLRNLTGKVRIAAGCQLKNTDFRGTLIKSFSIFGSRKDKQEKSFKDLSETFLILRYF